MLEVVQIDIIDEIDEDERKFLEIVDVWHIDEVEEVEVEVDTTHETDEMVEHLDMQYGMYVDILIDETDEMVEFGENEVRVDDLEQNFIITVIFISVIRIDEIEVMVI